MYYCLNLTESKKSSEAHKKFVSFVTKNFNMWDIVNKEFEINELSDYLEINEIFESATLMFSQIAYEQNSVEIYTNNSNTIIQFLKGIFLKINLSMEDFKIEIKN